jgi:OmpA-OmpF porin, OOP family
MRLILGAALLALVAGNAAWAHDEASADEQGKPHSHWWLDMNVDLGVTWYAGAGLGQSRYHNYALRDDGSFTSRSTDDTGTALRVFGGMGIGKYFGLEASYADYGEATSRAQSDGSSGFWNAGPQAEKIAAKGYDFSLLGRVPIAGDWAVFAKVGGSWLDVGHAVDLDVQGPGAINASSKTTEEGVSYGGGVQYDGWRPVRVITEYGAMPFDVDFFADDGKLDWIAISAAYLF